MGYYRLVLENMNPPFKIARAILPGGNGVTGRQDGTALQKSSNVDFQHAFIGATADLSNLRFRHMNNTILNALAWMDMWKVAESGR